MTSRRRLRGQSLGTSLALQTPLASPSPSPCTPNTCAPAANKKAAILGVSAKTPPPASAQQQFLQLGAGSLADQELRHQLPSPTSCSRHCPASHGACWPGAGVPANLFQACASTHRAQDKAGGPGHCQIQGSACHCQGGAQHLGVQITSPRSPALYKQSQDPPPSPRDMQRKVTSRSGIVTPGPRSGHATQQCQP